MGDANNRVAVVTGANRGIGRWIALGLAATGHHVVMLVRDPAAGEAARRWIAQGCPGASTELLIADLSTIAATRAAAAAIVAAHPAVAVLVNNAGMFSAHRRETADGHEQVLAVNHLAPFVLTRGLEGALRAGAPSRVVNIGSAASDRTGIDLDDLQSRRRWSIWGTYARSKLALMMASFEWARRLQGTGVTVNVVHPGLVRTDLGSVPGPAGWGWKLVAAFGISEQEGADTPLFTAVSPRAAGQTGLYWKKRVPARPNRRALDPAICARLWRATEELVGE